MGRRQAWTEQESKSKASYTPSFPNFGPCGAVLQQLCAYPPRRRVAEKIGTGRGYGRRKREREGEGRVPQHLLKLGEEEQKLEGEEEELQGKKELEGGTRRIEG